MTKKMAGALVATLMFAACSASQGPTWNAYSVDLPDGQRAYRVDCQGLFEGQNDCYSKAKEICGDQQIRPLERVAPLAGANSTPNVQKLTFQCGAAPQPVRSEPQWTPVPSPQKRVTPDGDANFDTDRATLRPDARARLDALVEDARGSRFTTVMVDGYTDSTGSVAHNQALSEHRAQSVAQYLRDRGLQVQQIVPHGHGERHPVASNATAGGRAQNRRVEIRLE